MEPLEDLINPFLEPTEKYFIGKDVEMTRVKKHYPPLDKKIYDLQILKTEIEQLEESLLPGDLILSFYPKSYTIVQKTIRTVQWFSDKKSKKSCSYLHVSVYLGEGKVAEAIRGSDGVDLKINFLSHEHFKRKEGQTNEFHIFRCKSEKIALKVAKLAKVIAKEKENEERSFYNFTSACFSPFADKGMNQGALKRYLKAAHFAKNKKLPFDRYGPRNFHCSSFAIWLYQAAESKYIIKEIDETSNSKIDLPIIENNEGIELSNWAKKEAKEHEKLLQEFIEIDINGKLVTPSDVYHFCMSKPYLFQQVFQVKPENVN